MCNCQTKQRFMKKLECIPARYEMITALKKRFPVNNPTSWGRHSNKKLRQWYDEYIREKEV